MVRPTDTVKPTLAHVAHVAVSTMDLLILDRAGGVLTAP